MFKVSFYTDDEFGSVLILILKYLNPSCRTCFGTPHAEQNTRFIPVLWGADPNACRDGMTVGLVRVLAQASACDPLMSQADACARYKGFVSILDSRLSIILKFLLHTQQSN
jgi:hypothetical protein